MRITRCDNCGKDQRDPYLAPFDERQILREEQADKVIITAEHNEDSMHFDACSWVCVAELATKRATDSGLTKLERGDRSE